MNSNPSDPTASTADGFFDSLRRMRVPRTHDRWIGGVAAGLAHRLGVDPLILRGVFLLVTLFGGFGLLVYGVAWALLPEQSDGRIHLQEAFRGRFDAALAGAILLTVIGLSRAGFWWSGWGGLPVSLGVVALIALIVVLGVAIQNGRRDDGPRPGGAGASGGPVPPGATGPGGTDGPGSANGPSGTPWAGHPGDPWGYRDAAPPPAAPAGTAGETVAFATPPASAEPIAPGDPAAPTQSSEPAEPHDPTDRETHAAEETHVLPAPTDPDWSHMTTTSTPAGHASWPGNAPNADGAGQPPMNQPPVPPASQPPTPPPPPKPRVPGPGALLVRVIFGVVLLLVAILLYAGYAEPGNAWSAPLLALGGAVALFGLGAVIAGLIGRRSGSLGVLGTLVALVAVPWALVHSADVHHRFDWNDAGSYGEETWRPATAAEAMAGYDHLAAGAVVVDLTDLEDVPVPDPVEIELGAGELVVLVPEGMPITIETSVTGEVTTRNLDGWSAQVDGRATQTINGDIDYGWRFGGNREATITSPEATEAGVTALDLQVDLGFGEIVIEER